MKRSHSPNSLSSLAQRSHPELEARKQEILDGLEAGTIELKPFYWDLRNRIIRPWETVQTSRYFWYRWTPVLGPTYTVIIINFRLLCAEQDSKEGDPGRLVVPHAKLAELSGLSAPTIKRQLAPRTFRDPSKWFLPLFLSPYKRYVYDPKMRKKIRDTNGYKVAMDDPLLPQDKKLLRGLYAEEEISQMIRDGVVDLHKYSEFKHNRPKDQIDLQVQDQIDLQVQIRTDPGPKDQIDLQVQDQIDLQVQPITIKGQS